MNPVSAVLGIAALLAALIFLAKVVSDRVALLHSGKNPDLPAPDTIAERILAQADWEDRSQWKEDEEVEFTYDVYGFGEPYRALIWACVSATRKRLVVTVYYRDCLQDDEVGLAHRLAEHLIAKGAYACAACAFESPSRHQSPRLPYPRLV